MGHDDVSKREANKNVKNDDTHHKNVKTSKVEGGARQTSSK